MNHPTNNHQMSQIKLSNEIRDLIVKEIGTLLKQQVSLKQTLREQDSQNQAANEELFLELLEIVDALDFLMEYMANNPDPSPQFIQRLPKSVGSVQNNQLSNPNPYDVLEVSPGASNAEITKAFTLAMKKRSYSPDIIAKARKTLMNQEERILADYFRPILPPIQRFKRTDFSELETPEPQVEFLSEFDNLETMIQQINQISEVDKQLGATLF